VLVSGSARTHTASRKRPSRNAALPRSLKLSACALDDGDTGLSASYTTSRATHDRHGRHNTHARRRSHTMGNKTRACI
jgi:hypothetical protein